MQTYYLVDFENVHNEGIENIEKMTKDDHVHIFSTENATNIRNDIFWMNGDIQSHLVPVRKQSLDMHLVSYLGHLLALHGEECSYVIISKDKDYDNIVKFWIDKGYTNVSRKEKLLGKAPAQKKASNTKAAEATIRKFEGEERCELNEYIQHGVKAMGYDSSSANKICKIVVGRCNDERMLRDIHNDLRYIFKESEYLTVYEDVKRLLDNFEPRKARLAKREAQIRCFYGQHFKKNIYKVHKEETIQSILNGKTKIEVNNSLMKIYTDGTVVSHIYKKIQPLIAELPGQ